VRSLKLRLKAERLSNPTSKATEAILNSLSLRRLFASMTRRWIRNSLKPMPTYALKRPAQSGRCHTETIADIFK